MAVLTTREAADLLGVSGATVRNWCRAGYLPASSDCPLAFDADEVAALKERIRTNRFNRLRKRANKSASEKTPAAAPQDAQLLADLSRFRNLLAEAETDPGSFLYGVTLRYLKLMDEAVFPDAPHLDVRNVAWRRTAIGKIMLGWRERVAGPVAWPHARDIDSLLDVGPEADRLGVLYQHLSSVGAKARGGVFFTPNRIIDDSLTDLGVIPDSFLDPCCGTGRYLMRAADRFGLDPRRIFGYDSDPVAVDIARLNLLLMYQDADFIPHVYCLDSLRDLANGDAGCETNHLLGGVHAIATNPPWGCRGTMLHNRKRVEAVRSGESFSLFLEKSLRLLRDEGRLSFVLPESILKIKAHADIRRVLLRETSIRKITLLGRAFADVFTPVMRLDLVKKPASRGWRVAVSREGRVHHCPQRRFAANDGCAFDITVTPEDEELLAKIHRMSHWTLKNHADWALGIVTGDNGRHVLDAPVPGSEPVLRGRDLDKFAPRPPRCHIRFTPRAFQQVAPERLYRAPEKLVYRFVSDRLVFAYDDQGLLTLNSANIVIPRLPGLSVKAALAFLNSQVFQYIFTKRFRTRKILRGDLERFPFPVLTASVKDAIERQVDLCMGGEYQPAEELDRMVSEAFGLSDDDAQTIRGCLESDPEAAYP